MAMTQTIQESSAVQNYPIGMRHAQDDRVFRYSHLADVALAGNLSSFWGHANYNLVSINHVALPQVTVVGSYDVTITDAAGTLNQYRDGFLFIHRAAGYRNQGYRIRGNDASVGGLVVLHLYQPITVASSVGCRVYVQMNMYSNVIYAGLVAPHSYVSIVCVPWVCPVRNEYFWGQTWGPCWGFYTSTPPGAAEKTRDLAFAPGGELILVSQLQAFYGDGLSSQRAGYVLPHTALADGSCHYMLQLSP